MRIDGVVVCCTLVQLSANSHKTSVGAEPLKLLSRRQVGEIACVHAGTVKRWEVSGALRAIKINARVTRYDESEVRRFIQEARVA